MAEQIESTRPEFLKLLQSVPILDSLRETPYGTMPDITINCWREDIQDFETVVWNIAYPFYTLDDLKLDIYLQRGAKPEWLPSQVFIGVLVSTDEDPEDEFIPATAIWRDIPSEYSRKADILRLKSPLDICTAGRPADERFVDRSGNERPLNLDQRGRTTLESAYLTGGDTMPEFYAFCFSDMLRRFGLGPGRPVPAYDWNGRFRPFFPALKSDAYEATDAANTEIKIAYKRQVRQLLRVIEDQLTTSTEPTVASKMQVSAVYALRILLGRPAEDGFTSVEELFFRTLATEERPFIRILPAESGPITKIHVKGIVPIPDILDPNLLPQWGQEITPTPGSDYLFAKILSKGLGGGSLPIYSTLRVFADGSADVVILPSKQQRFLNPASDLRNLDLTIEAGLKGSYLENASLSIGEATVEISLQLSRQSTPLTRTRLLERLGLFSYFFQEAPAFESPAPILLLKYKAVDQFATEPRIFSYIAQYEARSIISGGRMKLPLLDAVAQEFSLDRESAALILSKWADEKSKFVPIVPEINTFSEENDGGIDVGIYGQHPFYFIRIYRCNSEITLRRIYTLLSLMLTLDLDFGGAESPEAASAVAEAASAEEESKVAEIAATPLPFRPATVAAAAAPSTWQLGTEHPSTLREAESDDEEALIRPLGAKSRALINDDEDALGPLPTIPLATAKKPIATLLVNSDDEEEAAPPPPRSSVATTRALLVNSDDEEETAAPVPTLKTVPAATAPTKKPMASLMVNSDDEEETAAPVPTLKTVPAATAPTKKPMASLMVNSDDEEEAAPAATPKKPMATSEQKAATTAPLTIKRESAQPMTIKRQAAPAAQPEESTAGKDWPSPLRGWFVKQLNRIDPKLFVFKPKHGDQDGYSRKCQAASGQQPMVLTQAEYDRMREEYQKDEDDGRVVFIEFPLKGDEPDPPSTETIERITVLKYGADPANQNYYFCPKLFCLLDRILILQADFEGDEWRNPDKKGKKAPDTCPFCGGKRIDDQIKYNAGHTVAVRKDKPMTNQKQTYIDFTNPTTHPDGFQLPCCYIPPREKKPGDFLEKSKRMHISNEIFAHLRGVAESKEEEEEDEEDFMSAAAEGLMEPFTLAIASFPRKYILNPTFHPLERAKFGLCPPNLDAYFNQKSDNLVSRTAIKQLMRPGIKGFFRMGVEGASRGHPDNFFGAVAPYMGKNSADEVKMAFVEKLRDPNIFLNVNYGNLVHEFYRPAQQQYRPQNVNELEQDFIKLVKVAAYNPAISKPEMLRLYMAHNLFMEYLTSRSTIKEYRIFAPILAYPGLITARGLILILLEYDSSDFSKPVSVKCPPLGYQPNLYDGADFGFMLRDTQGIYEAIVYIEHSPGVAGGRHNGYTSFQVSQLPSVAPVVAERRTEFMSRCKAPTYNLYTGQSSIRNSRSMLTFSQLVSQSFLSTVHPNESALYPYSIVRDSYNHIVGTTFKYEYRGTTVLIPLPLVDHDGYMPLGHPVHFDWSSIDEALLPTVPALVQFYERFLGTVIEGACPGYRPVKVLRSGKRIRAVQLENGLIVPAKGSDSPLPIDDVQFVPEWQINREIAFSDNQMPADESDSIELMEAKSLEELYQHFRLSVAGWLNSELPTEFLKNLENNIIFNKGLPTFEKRKRLKIELEDTLRSWFVEEDDFILEEEIFYRQDCRKIKDAGSCSGACAWISANATKLGEQQTGEEGRCGIHIPSEATLTGDVLVNTADLFIRRVIDELIIFPDRRRQLLMNTVKKTGNITTAIQIGDQYIIPDSSPRWQELLSLIWATEKSEAYQSLEESKGVPQEEQDDEEGETCVPFDRSVPYTIQKIRRRPAAAAAAAAPFEEAAKAIPIPPLTESRPMTIRRLPTAAAAPITTIKSMPAAAAAAPITTIKSMPAAAAAAPITTIRRMPAAAAASVMNTALSPIPTIRRLPTAAAAAPIMSVPEEVISRPLTIRRAMPKETPSPLSAAAAPPEEGNIVSITAAPKMTIRRAVKFPNGLRPGQTPPTSKKPK